jgi:hypothetical protein
MRHRSIEPRAKVSLAGIFCRGAGTFLPAGPWRGALISSNPLKF